MAILADIRTGLKNRLATITGLNTYDKAPGTATVPAAFPIPVPPIEYDETERSDVTDYHLQIKLLVQLSTSTYAQEDLDPYLSPSGTFSIRGAVNGDGTLGGVADWTRVSRCSKYGIVEHNGIQYLGAEFDVEVNSSGA